MESGTLDFEDLMDTGDFPGFEIAKFTPAGDDKENGGDGILRTPEHRREDDDDDFVLQQTKISNPENSVSENGDCEKLKNKIQDQPVKETTEEPKPNNGETLDEEKSEQEHSINDLPGVDFEDGVGKHDASGDAAGDGESNFTVVLNKDYTEDEPVPKKKKMSLLPASKPKMKLWGGNKKKEETRNQVNNDAQDQSEGSTEENDKQVDKTSSPAKNDAKGDAKDEDNPHQQSFLSFLNLQPGSSKPTDESKKKQEKTKTEDFYARKRLRTRKKVSYCEDVMEEPDEEYKGDEEEMPYDHEISIPKSRRRSSSGNAHKHNPSPVNSNAKTNSSAAAALAMAKYAAAMQKLSIPQKSTMQQKNIPLVQAVNKPANPVPQQHNTAQLYKNILSSVTQNDGSEEGQSNGPMKGLFECGLCGTFFNTAGQFIAHQETAHTTDNKTGRSGMETFRCEVCQFVLTNRFAYLEHKRMKHSKNQVTFNCSKCGSSFGYLIDLQKHKQICGLPYTYTCTNCNLQLKDMQEMMAHKAKFHPPTSSLSNTRQWVTCAQRHCTFKCLTQMEMKHHVQNKHNLQAKNPAGELFTCNAPRCNKIFNTRDKLNDHKREAHASEFIVQYQCMECKACYSTKTLLAEHQYLHMMDKLKKCDLCNRRFNTYNQLVKHKEVHATKGTYRCTACTRWCEDRHELALHVCREKKAKLLGLRIYFCDVCHRDFKTDEQLFSHRAIHKNYYQCNTCRWEEKEEEEYFKHRELHGLFTCRECCEEIPTEAELSTHMKAHEYYIKMEEVEEEDGKPMSVMYLCPNLVNTIKTEDEEEEAS